MDKIKNCTEATSWLCYANSINPFQQSPRTHYPPPPHKPKPSLTYLLTTSPTLLLINQAMGVDFVSKDFKTD